MSKSLMLVGMALLVGASTAAATEKPAKPKPSNRPIKALLVTGG